MENIDICKRAIKDYKDIRFIINELINHGCDFEYFKTFIDTLNNTDIINVCCDEDFKYIDFGYRETTLTIYNDYCGLYLGDTIEVWNNETGEFINTFDNVEDIEKYVEELELSDKLTEKMFNFSNELNDKELDFAIKELQFWKKEREKQEKEN